MTGPTIFIAGTVIGVLTVGIPLVIALFNAQRDIEILSDARDGLADQLVGQRTARLEAETALAVIGRRTLLTPHKLPSDKDQRHDA